MEQINLEDVVLKVNPVDSSSKIFSIPVRFIVDENVVGPGYPQQLLIQINHIGGGSAGQIGHFIIEGNVKKPKSTAKVIFKKGKTSVKLP